MLGSNAQLEGFQEAACWLLFDTGMGSEGDTLARSEWVPLEQSMHFSVTLFDTNSPVQKKKRARCS